MTTKQGNTSPVGEVSKKEVRTVVASSIVGTTIEWYDFFLYGIAAGLVFNKLYFPSEDPLVGTLLAFATFAVGFVARPVGGLIFGILPVLLRTIAEPEAQWIIYGMIMIVIVYFLPDGIVPAVRALVEGLQSRRGAAEPTALTGAPAAERKAD
jgi:MFS family permease